MTEDDKTLYALGLMLGRNLASFNLSPAELETVNKGVVDAATNRKAQVDLLWERLEGGEPVLSAIGAGQRELDAVSTRLLAKAEEIESTGCVLRDLEVGLVDFPFRSRTGTVFLCWRVGEPAILFWHGADEGFAGRKPIEQLPLDRA